MGIKLYILSSGSQIIAKRKLFAEAEESEKIEIPIPYYLVDAGEEKILIDSGISDEGSSSGLSTVKDVRNPVDALKEIGISKEEIAAIVHTHLHFDHAANTKLFPNAKVIVQLAELRAAYFPDKEIKHGYVERDIKHPDIQWEPIVGFKSMLERRLLIIPTPGHTPGHQSVLIRLKDHKCVIITGDAAPLKENIDKTVPPGVASNNYEAFCALRSLKELAVFHRAEFWYGHDPDFYAHVKMAPDFYE